MEPLSYDESEFLMMLKLYEDIILESDFPEVSDGFEFGTRKTVFGLVIWFAAKSQSLALREIQDFRDEEEADPYGARLYECTLPGVVGVVRVCRASLDTDAPYAMKQYGSDKYVFWPVHRAENADYPSWCNNDVKFV